MVLSSAIFLSSCALPIAQHKAITLSLLATANGVFARPDVNLTEKNHAAADYMVGQYRDRFSVHDDFAFTPLEELDHAGITSPFGKSVSEGIGMRFSELGYRVWLKDVAMDGNERLYPAPPSNHTPKFALRGTYDVQQKQVQVYLRMINVKTSQIVAHFDYAMPITKEIKEMSKTEARIFRVKR